MWFPPPLIFLLTAASAKAGTIIADMEVRHGMAAAVLKVVCEEALEKELLHRVLEPCSIYSSSLVPVSSPWFVLTTITVNGFLAS